MTARDLLKLGATHLVAEGNEATIGGLVEAGPGTPVVDEDGDEVKIREPDAEPLLSGFTLELENRTQAGTTALDSGTDPVTHLPSDSSFAARLAELCQGETLPRVGFIRIANANVALNRLDRATLDLVRRRLVLQFRNLIADRSVELFMIEGLELAIISTVLTAPQMGRLAHELVVAAESFAPSGREPIRLAIGHAGSEVANEPRTLKELATSATAAAVALGGGVVSGDELALSRANATENDAASELASWIDELDYHGGDHGNRVAELALAIGRELGVEGLDLVRLRLAAKLHDIGKIHFADDLVDTDPNSLSSDDLERRTVSIPQTVLHYWLCQPTRRLTAAVKSHHEAWDGSGFPDGLSEDEITFAARIIAVADHVDSLARPVEANIKVILEALEVTARTAHDPAVVWATNTLLRAGDLDHILVQEPPRGA